MYQVAFDLYRTYLLSKRVNWCQRDGFSNMGAQMGAIKLVLRISDVGFLHCWVTDSILLECAESLITKQ